MAIAGSWACQRDSYLKELKTKVKSCEAASLPVVNNGKKHKVPGYEVILEDTILFPEGGGQPDDRGTVGGIDVISVTRRHGDAIHFLSAPLDPGAEVELKVDWNRRFDNMQQHTGQHLITALADSIFGFATTSWNLGEKTSFIELDTCSMSTEQVNHLEEVVNEKIRACVPVHPTVFESKEDPILAKFRTLGLPDDHVGPVRMIAIEGIDTTLCCGTHLANLSHLQGIKLLGVEKGKKGKVNLVFVAGQRLLNYLGHCYENEKALTGLLKGPSEKHVELLDKLQKSYATTRKNATTLLRTVAVLEASQYKSDPKRPPFLSVHRREGDNEYMNIIVNEVADPNSLIFLTTGDDHGAGLFMLAGPEETVAHLGPKVTELIEGKGAGKKGRFQGKANKLQRRHLVEKLLQEYIDSQGT